LYTGWQQANADGGKGGLDCVWYAMQRCFATVRLIQRPGGSVELHATVTPVVDVALFESVIRMSG